MKIDRVEWLHRARFGGFDGPVVAVPVSDGRYLISGLVDGSVCSLMTSRGTLRIFSSLDTLVKYLSQHDIYNFEVTGYD